MKQALVALCVFRCSALVLCRSNSPWCISKETELLIRNNRILDLEFLFFPNKKNWIVGPSPPKPMHLRKPMSGSILNIKSNSPSQVTTHRHPPTVRLYLAPLHLLQELNRMFPFTFPICASTDGCVVGYHVGICPASDVIQQNQCQICQFRI